jgi:hypothetical protein
LQIGINPMLLLSGIEGLYTFRDVALGSVPFEFLDSLILTIFALRVGDEFHSIAEQNLQSNDPSVLNAAAGELRILPLEDIAGSGNEYLISFARLLDGKTNVRVYHVKALEVAALENRKAQLHFASNSIGNIVIDICKEHLADSVDLGALFGS